jgi:hypothetical protein
MTGSMMSGRSAQRLAPPPPSVSGVSRAGAGATTAENIGRAAMGTRAKVSDLEDLSQRFVPFYQELEQGVQEVYEGQEDRLTGIERWVQRIERSLVTEQQRRVEMFGLVESNLQAQVDSLGRMAQAQIAELAPDIPARIGSWHQRLAVAEQDIADERVRRNAAIERERVRLLQQVEDLQRRLEVSKVERLERETLLLKKIIDDNDGMGRNIDDERSKRESSLGHLRDENDVTARLSEKPNRLFKEDMVSRMVSATTNIKKETLQRVGAERNFVESLEQVRLRCPSLKSPTLSSSARPFRPPHSSPPNLLPPSPLSRCGGQRPAIDPFHKTSWPLYLGLAMVEIASIRSRKQDEMCGGQEFLEGVYSPPISPEVPNPFLIWTPMTATTLTTSQPPASFPMLTPPPFPSPTTPSTQRRCRGAYRWSITSTRIPGRCRPSTGRGPRWAPCDAAGASSCSVAVLPCCRTGWERLPVTVCRAGAPAGWPAVITASRRVVSLDDSLFRTNTNRWGGWWWWLYGLSLSAGHGRRRAPAPIKNPTTSKFGPNRTKASADDGAAGG